MDMKKILSVLLTVTMLCGTVVTVFAADTPSKEYPQKFYDVPKDHWAFSYIAELADRGVIAGYEDGSFKPNNTVTRAEWAKIMVGAAGIPTNDNSVYFSDMQNHWSIPYVNAAKDYLTAYSDNTYRPNQAAVREDVTMAMVKLKGYDLSSVDYSYLSNFTDTDSISNNIKQYVAVAVEKGLISGFEDNTFRGQATITRAEAATLLWRAFQYGNDNKVVDTPSQTVVTPPTTQGTQVAPTQTPTQAEPVVEPTAELASVAPEKTYKIDTLIKADVKDRYYYTYDNNNTIYYVEDNTVYSVNVNTGSKNTILSADELVIDNDEMTLEDFEIKNIFCDTNNGNLYIRGNYNTVNSAKNVDNNYLYSINGGIKVITDNFPGEDIIGVLSNGDYFAGFYIIDSATFNIGEQLRYGAQEGFVESGNSLYYWAYSGAGRGYLCKYNYVDVSEEWNCPVSAYCAGFTNNSVVVASDDSIHTYNFNGKEISSITPDDYEVADRTKIDFSNAQSFRLAITPKNNVIFYDTSAKAFRIVVKLGSTYAISEDNDFINVATILSQNIQSDSMLIAALFDENNMLLDADISEHSSDVIETTLVNDSRAIRIKVFVWDDDMRPLISAEHINL